MGVNLLSIKMAHTSQQKCGPSEMWTDLHSLQCVVSEATNFQLRWPVLDVTVVLGFANLSAENCIVLF